MIYAGKNHRLDKDKALYRVVSELNRMQRARWNAPIIPLTEPYQRGWTRTYKLRDDVSRRREAESIQYALNLVNSIQWVKEKDKPPVNRYGNEIRLKLKVIPERRFASMNLPQNVTKWMSLGYHYEPGAWYLSNPTYGWSLSVPDYFLVYDYQPNIITHARVAMPEVESRIKELEAELEKYGGWYRHGKLKGYKNKWRDHIRGSKAARNTEAINEDLTDL